MCGLIIDPPPPLREAVTSSCGAVQGEGGCRKPPLRCGKKAPWWCQSRGASDITLAKKLEAYQQLLESTLTYIAELVALSA